MTSVDGVEWDAELYAKNTAHHRAYDDHVLDPLDLRPGWQVLDIGSGAGDFSARLAALVPDGSVLGVDLSRALVERARASHSDVANLSFETLGAQHLDELVPSPVGSLQSGPPFDLAISTATLHWVPGEDHPRLYRTLRQLLRPGGWFRAEFGGAGQMTDTLEVLNEESVRLGGPRTPWYFPEPVEVADRLVDAGFNLEAGFVRLVPQLRSVPDAAALRSWLESQVLIAYRPGLGNRYEAFRRIVIERLTDEGRRHDDSYDQHYVRLDLLCQALENS